MPSLSVAPLKVYLNSLHSLYFAFCPLPLALLILPLSLFEHHNFCLVHIHFQLFSPHLLSQATHHFYHFSLSQPLPKSPCRPQTPGSKLSPCPLQPSRLRFPQHFVHVRRVYRADRAALSHSLRRLKPFTLFRLLFVLAYYLLDLPHQPFAYSSLSHTFNIFSLSTLSNAALKSTNSRYLLPLSSSVRSLLNCTGCTHCP
jgi:hypothetical protein